MKKPFYKKWLFWVIIITIGMIGININSKKTEEAKATSSDTQQVEKNIKKQSQDEEKERLKKEKEEETAKLEAEAKKEAKKEKNKESTLTVDEYKNRINNALKEMGEKTNLKINSTEVLEDGRTSIALSNNIFIFLDTDQNKNIKKASLGMTPNAFFTEQKDFKFAFLLLIGTIDDTLSFGERNLVKQELGLNDETIFSKDHTKVYQKNKIRYTYKGSTKENFILQAELRK